MKRFWKQFAASAIGLKNNPFAWARAKLTFVYFIILVFLVGLFSVALYRAAVVNIRDSFNGQFVDETDQAEIIAAAKDKIAESILLIDGITISIFTLLGYFLAGRTLKPIREAMSAEKQFSEDAAHELRTPLAIMRASLDVALANKNLTANGAKHVMKSNLEEVDRMTRLSASLLALSKEDHKLNNKNFHVIDLQKLTIKVASRLKPVTAKKDIDLKIIENEPIFILGDEESLETAITNVLQNAIHYTRGGGFVEVRIDRQNSKAVLTIKDTGVGIEPEDIARIFNRFYRADKSRSRDTGGAGLGLSIVEKIVKRHRGDISIESIPKVGTNVSIAFELLRDSS